MTKKRDRFFALFGALLFLGTASALTIAVVANGISNHNATVKANKAQDAAEAKANGSTKDTDTSSTKSTADTSSTDNTTKGTTKLEGTKLTNFTTISKISELKTEDTTAGTGDAVKSGDTITVDYTGALASTGVIFQSSLDTGKTISFSLSGVIEGWQKGIPGMKVGGTRRLFIPAAQAYGSQAQSGIPANSDLIFDVTLHKIGS